LAQICALHFHLTGTFHQDFSHRDASDDRPDQSIRSRWKEQSVFADVPGRRPPRGHGEHDNTKGQHR
jgi:hypothetical protein